ncbi:MAG TPA: CATRA conflict system CASPASE/TPR repeat-associated protein, partial [Candidatus Dormibacteraeota bacterium]|nr:CATRA conflict system CASPASE/TPR repeat-associated protein [Candidatus Dormibacteraeota bacterium]
GVACLAAALAPLPSSGAGWRELDAEWTRAARGTGDAWLGEARLYLAQASGPDESAIDAGAELAARASAALPAGAPPHDAWSSGQLVERRHAVWETSTLPDSRATRRIVALARQGFGAELSGWTWSPGDLRMPPFGAYLLNSAKVRYHLRVWERGREFRRTRQRLDQAEGDLASRLKSTAGALQAMRADEARLVVTARRLREMRQSVLDACANMKALLPEVAPSAAGRGIFEDDRDLGDWFASQLDSDARLLDVAEQSARRVRELAAATGAAEVPRGPDPGGVPDRERRVFVVHGRDEQLRKALFEFLRTLDLKPLEWEALVKETRETVPFLGDVIATGLPGVQAVVALLTPDDVVSLHSGLRAENEDSFELVPMGQARPNVLIELGMALAACPERTVVLEVGTMRPIADLGGRNVIRFDGSAASLGKIVERLKLAGCRVDDSGSDWRDPGRFAGLDAYTRRP